MTDINDAPPAATAPVIASAAAAAKVTVFYDGACPLCSAEIGYYRRRRGAENVAWVDVSGCPTDTVTPDLSRQQALQRFHVRDSQGQLVSGGRAFAVLWTALPAFAWIGRLFRQKPFSWVIDRAYDGFLVWRPRLQALARRSAGVGQ